MGLRALASASLVLVISTALATPTTQMGSCHLASSVSWQNCSIFGYIDTSDAVKPQCAYYTVPLDYHNCTAGTVNLAVVKRPASVQPKLGTLFVNPGKVSRGVGYHYPALTPRIDIKGGPGGAGTDYVLTAHPELGTTAGTSHSTGRKLRD